MPRHKTDANQEPAAVADYSALVCQVLKTCLDNRLSKLPSIPLVKFLYLSECEYYRLYRRRLSSLGWFFYKFGPWAKEFTGDSNLVEMEKKSVATNKCIKYRKLDWLDAKRHGDYIEDSDACGVVRRVVTPWALRYTEEEAHWDLITRELLNEVYFHTAPMRHARFKDTLDFTLIPPAMPTVELKIDPKWVVEVKRKFRDARKKAEPGRSLYPLPELAPVVRENVAAALQRLNDEEGPWLTNDVRVKLDTAGGSFGIE